MQAVKRNTTLTIQFVTEGNVPIAVAKPAANGRMAAAPDPQVQLGGSTFRVAVPDGSVPPLTDATLSYTPLSLPDLVSLNSRGLPCKYVSGVCSTAGFVYYVNDSARRNAWTAVSISPGGRVKQWFWNGKAWAD
jgi:hypothetical protein